MRESVSDTTPRYEHPLRLRERPYRHAFASALRLVDLFSGCGGLTLGIVEAATAAGKSVNIRLAVDFETAATDVYRANFPETAAIETAPVEDLFNGSIGGPLTKQEKRMQELVGKVDLLVGGPPCQGNSTLNNHTRALDPKNGLYLLMARAAEVLKPDLLLIENVPAVLRDRHGDRNVVESVRETLVQLGYQVDDRIVSLHALGVAQLRRRHILIATKEGLRTPTSILDGLEKHSDPKNLCWAIGDLEHAQGTGWDAPPVANSTNIARMRYLLDNDLLDLPNDQRPKCHQNAHSYKSMYGRLRWDLPAQTLTSGFGSIGQGRYMHPTQLRALTAHEAARIQGFPDYFDFSQVQGRSRLAVMIGNAVPPPLGRKVLSEFLKQSE